MSLDDCCYSTVLEKHSLYFDAAAPRGFVVFIYKGVAVLKSLKI